MIAVASADAAGPSVGEPTWAAHEPRASAAQFAGIPLTLATRTAAIAMLRRLMARDAARAHWVCFLNSHSFNSATLDRQCRDALNGASAVFPDGCAMHVAARLRGIRIPDNLPGTDLIPALLELCSGRCFLIGDAPERIERAARELERRFPTWSVVGYAPGYFESEEGERRVVDRVNRAEPDLLLIGMGSPLQERFVLRYAEDLRVPLCVCVGGLLSYWSGRLVRAPRLMRRLCLEWLWILAQQPHKLGRYTVGIARFFAAVVPHVWRELTRS